jgi:hypothetical protein
MAGRASSRKGAPLIRLWWQMVASIKPCATQKKRTSESVRRDKRRAGLGGDSLHAAKRTNASTRFAVCILSTSCIMRSICVDSIAHHAIDMSCHTFATIMKEPSTYAQFK